jgi:hypothetical protein
MLFVMMHRCAGALGGWGYPICRGELGGPGALAWDIAWPVPEQWWRGGWADIKRRGWVGR